MFIRSAGIPVLHATHGAGCRRRRCFFQGGPRARPEHCGRARRQRLCGGRPARASVANSPEYIELVYACSWLGVTAVPINARLSAAESIEFCLMQNHAAGAAFLSSYACGSAPWQLILDEQPLDSRNDSCPDPVYDPEAILALIYTSGTTGRPKGVMVSHANILANLDHFSYWMGYREGGVYLHAAPIFHIADFPTMFAAPALGARQVTIPKFTRKVSVSWSNANA